MFDVKNTDTHKIFRSEDCNFIFNKVDGTMITWGETINDNPSSAPFPFILDIEVSEICSWPNGKACNFCYKSNTQDGKVMSFDTFKNIIDKMPWLTQIAFGSGSAGDENPEIFKMMEYARSKSIIPNITVSDITDETAVKLANVCGAVAVSFYKHAEFETGIKTVERLLNAGMKQVNIHYMISKNTIADAYEVCDLVKNDSRLKGLNAIVFLALKQKGRGVNKETVSFEEYKELVDYCLTNEIPFGFDSCSAPTFLNSVKDHELFDKMYQMAEDCESTLFSSYIDVNGDFYPCSFTEGWFEGGWSKGINVVQCTDFINDVWNHPKTEKFRNTLLNNTSDINNIKCRNCPAFSICS